MSRTNIEWVRNPDGSKGETWPVVTGCTPVSGGCRNCYAARMAATRLKHHPRYEGLATIENGKARWTGKVRLNRDVLEQPLRWKKPRQVFVASMGDLFHSDVPWDFVWQVIEIIRQCPQHTFQILTKRPGMMEGFFRRVAANLWPLSNLWLGTSIENQAAADERIPLLLRTPAAVHYVSVEPCLSAVDLTPYLPQVCAVHNCVHRGGRDCLRPRDDQPTCLDWVICGGESGPGARPMHPDWARSLRDQCQAAGVPFFFKQWGAWTPDVIQILECKPGDKRFAKVRGPGLPREIWMARVGKKHAGNLLDGRAWQEFPVQPKE